MPAADTAPIYNLKAVVRETGLKPDTLRAWERRYGIPEPVRTSGGHRLYSQRDIEVLKWLIARQDEGMSISRAVDLWYRLDSAGKDPLQMAEYVLSKTTGSAAILSSGESLADIRNAWIEACAAFEGQRAEALMAEAFALYPPETVCFEVLQKGLAEIGTGWYEGRYTVQQEHFASALAIRRLETLVAAAPVPHRPGRILIACPAEEDHIFSPLLLNLLLRRQGYDVVYLGANVPTERLEDTVAAAQPALVIMTAQQLHTADNLLQAARVLQRLRVPLGFGGLVFNIIPGLSDRIPAHFLGERLDEALPRIEHLLRARYSTFREEPLKADHAAALAHFRERQAMVDAQVWAQMEHSGIIHDNLSLANLHFGRNIAAALALGSIDFLSTDIEWVHGLLANLRIPSVLLNDYLKAYHEAARQNLDERGALIVNWLAQVVSD